MQLDTTMLYARKIFLPLWRLRYKGSFSMYTEREILGETINPKLLTYFFLIVGNKKFWTRI